MARRGGGLTEDPYADFENWIGRFEPVPIEEIPGFWGGAAGHFGYDMAIVIRALLSVADQVCAQAGTGILYNSDPTREWEEIEQKAKILFQALASDGMAD